MKGKKTLFSKGFFISVIQWLFVWGFMLYQQYFNYLFLTVLGCEKARKHICVTDRHDMTLAVKVALNPKTTNHLTVLKQSIILTLGGQCYSHNPYQQGESLGVIQTPDCILKDYVGINPCCAFQISSCFCSQCRSWLDFTIICSLIKIIFDLLC